MYVCMYVCMYAQLRSRFKLILTGTPVQNNLHETFCLLHFLFPKVFETSDAFDEAFKLNKQTVQVDRFDSHCLLLFLHLCMYVCMYVCMWLSLFIGML